MKIDHNGAKYDEHACIAKNFRTILFRFKYSDACEEEFRDLVDYTIKQLSGLPEFNSVKQIQVEYFLSCNPLRNAEEGIKYFLNHIKRLGKKPKMMALYKGVNPARLVVARGRMMIPNSLSSEQRRILKFIKIHGK